MSERPSDPRDRRMTAREADYMELAGARKDGDCRKVEVPDGISTELGCCNEFEPESKATKRFRCGDCEYQIVSKRNYLYGG